MEALQLFLDNFADWDSFVRIWPLLWQGFQLTVLLSVVTLPIAILVGLAIAVLYSFHNKVARVLLLIWIDLFRSFPVLVLLILIFYGLPFLGLKLPSFAACVLAIVLNNSGYYGEIFRAGIESIPHGQREARALSACTETKARTGCHPKGRMSRRSDTVDDDLDLGSGDRARNVAVGGQFGTQDCDLESRGHELGGQRLAHRRHSQG